MGNWMEQSVDHWNVYGEQDKWGEDPNQVCERTQPYILRMDRHPALHGRPQRSKPLASLQETAKDVSFPFVPLAASQPSKSLSAQAGIGSNRQTLKERDPAQRHDLSRTVPTRNTCTCCRHQLIKPTPHKRFTEFVCQHVRVQSIFMLAEVN